MSRNITPAMKTLLVVVLLIACLAASPLIAQDSWRDPSYKATLANDAIEAHFQGGLLVSLIDRQNRAILIDQDVAQIPAQTLIFGNAGLDLDQSRCTQETTAENLTAEFHAPDGTTWQLVWTIEPSMGDLVLNMTAHAPRPVNMFRYTFGGCDIADHRMVIISGYGASHVYQAPWEGVFGDPVAKDYSQSYNHPAVALLEGNNAGWFLEGRDTRIGPVNLFARGLGQTAQLAMTMGFPIATQNPQMFEIRIRTYKTHWEDAVDPYLEWMEKEAGFARVGTGYHPAWVKKIKNQVYVRCGDHDELENLARRVDPTKTVVGREVGWRKHPMDINYPDYRPNDSAKKWFAHARKLGFHVGAHFNSKGISKDNPELIKRFEPGLQIVRPDEQGPDKYDCVTGPHRHVYCSPAYKPWRDYLIEQMRPAVEAGVDIIYLDESMAPGGKFLVDGANGLDAMMLLMKETLEAYPGVAIETEQFNPMCTRYASFSLSQMGLGHPLSGYIFSRFIHILPEGIMGAPTDESPMNSYQAYGFILPSCNNDSWLQISKAFQDYDLVPDSRLPRYIWPTYVPDGREGRMPQGSPQQSSYRLFGYRGRNGVKAWYEKRNNQRALVLYEPGKSPRMIGTRVTGVRTWSGPGILRRYTSGVLKWSPWLIYDRQTMMGLGPTKSYALDETHTLDPKQFHVTAIPDDFAEYTGPDERTIPQDVGHNETLTTSLTFTGPWTNLRLRPRQHAHLPRRNTAAGRFNLPHGPSHGQRRPRQNPARCLAFTKTDTPLQGRWIDLPWQTPPNQRSWYASQHVMYGYPSSGPARGLSTTPTDSTPTVAGRVIIIGKLPPAKRIFIQGA